MGKCATCGNVYAGTFTVEQGSERYEFDSFECAIQKLAPECRTCGCRILGHGHEADQGMFCSAHCARSWGIDGLRDHA